MQMLLDTHYLVWVSGESRRLAANARNLIEDPANDFYFSVASIWELTIKQTRGKANFPIEPRTLRRRLLENGYNELAIAGSHVLAVASLPTLHHDPFDRILVAQASVEGLILLTADATIAQYPAPVRYIRPAANGTRTS